MNRDYSILLENLLSRRYDEARRESIVTDTFEECGYADVIRYTLESMEEIDPSYVYKTFHLAKRIQDKISREFDARGIKVDFRYQGPIQTETHVVLYGGVELMVLVDSRNEKPWKKVQSISLEIMDILTSESTYKEVNYQSKVKIKLVTLKPTCEITILPAVWLDNSDYMKSKREIDRAICEYNLAQKTRRNYLPFLNIARINSRDNRCNGGLKKMIRLLASLQRDINDPIELSHQEISSVLYGIPEKQMKFNGEYALSLLGVVSAQLNRVVVDKRYRESLISPSGRELVFGTKPHKLENLSKLKAELNLLIEDLQEVLRQDKKNLYSAITY